MPTPSPSWNLIRVHGLWHTQGGALLAGQYKVTIPARITNSTDDAIIPAGVFDQGELQTGVPNAPSLDIMVPATDDPDNEQAGWKVIIEVTFVGGAMGEKYVIDVPLATGAGGINLRQIALAAQIPAQNALYRVGVAGGLAKLNSNGDVIDADGTVVGGLDPVVLSGLNADIASKASNTALTSLTTSVAGKASTASVTSLYNTVSAIPAADTAIGTAVGNPVSATRVALDTVAGGPVAGLAATVATNGTALASKSTLGDTAIDAVRQYSVPTDGTSACQPSLSSAITAALGRRVILRRGDYKMSTRITTIKQGTVIEGEDPYSTTLLLSGSAFLAGASDVLIRNITFKGDASTIKAFWQGAATANVKNWRFENCRFDGVVINPSRIGATLPTGLTLPSGDSAATGLESYVELDRCEFYNSTLDGVVYSRGTHDVTVNRCYFHDSGASTSAGDVVKMSYGAQDWKITHNLFENGTRDAVDCYDGQRGLIQGNTMRNMGVHAVEIKLAAVTDPNPSDRIRVLDNYAYLCGNGSVGPSFQMSSSNLIVQGNTVEAARGYGFRSGKTTDGATNSKDISYMGNMAIGCVNHGFTAVGVDRVTYIGNHAKGSTTGKGYDVQTSSGNTSIIGGATLNQSSGNFTADTWS